MHAKPIATAAWSFPISVKLAYYSLDDEHIDTLMREALRHVREGVASAVFFAANHERMFIC
jgi:hypothetical protein